MSEAIEVYVAADSGEAHFLKGLLHDRGIFAQVVGESLQTALGDVPMGHSAAPRILVPEESAPEARRLLEEYEAQRKERHGNREGWSCPSCQAEVESQFTECWNCGASRPEDGSSA